MRLSASWTVRVLALALAFSMIDLLALAPSKLVSRDTVRLLPLSTSVLVLVLSVNTSPTGAVEFSAPAWPRTSLPFSMVTSPVKVLSPPSCSVAAPLLVKPKLLPPSPSTPLKIVVALSKVSVRVPVSVSGPVKVRLVGVPEDPKVMSPARVTALPTDLSPLVVGRMRPPARMSVPVPKLPPVRSAVVAEPVELRMTTTWPAVTVVSPE